VSRFRFGFAAVFAAAVSSLAAAPASASVCQPFPQISVWGDYTHARVKQIVASRLKGDWDTYIDFLSKRLDLITGVEKQGKTLSIEFEGVRYLYGGDELKRYVKAAEERQRIVRCLAEEATVAKLQQFSTAAGPTVAAAGSETGAFTEVASAVVGGAGAALIKDKGFNLALDMSCTGGNANFKFTNVGETWPMRGTISVYRLGVGEPMEVQARSLRFSGGQAVSLHVPVSKNSTGKLGVYVRPSWAKRDFVMDRVLDCK
jgi:hypothetical protein